MASMPPGTPRKYGIGGGAICPKCGRPFPLRLWWFNLGLSKIDRCPYCGKWSFVRPRSLTELREAETAELAQSQPNPTIGGETDTEKLKKDLDDSRFQNP
jgi:DNA-directed RNA polymerase subunit RPC12/RpoP